MDIRSHNAFRPIPRASKNIWWNIFWNINLLTARLISCHGIFSSVRSVIFIIIVVVVVVVTTLLFSEPYSFFFQLSFCTKSIDHRSTSYFTYLSQDKKKGLNINHSTNYVKLSTCIFTPDKYLKDLDSPHVYRNVKFPSLGKIHLFH